MLQMIAALSMRNLPASASTTKIKMKNVKASRIQPRIPEETANPQPGCIGGDASSSAALRG